MLLYNRFVLLSFFFKHTKRAIITFPNILLILKRNNSQIDLKLIYNIIILICTQRVDIIKLSCLNYFLIIVFVFCTIIYLWIIIKYYTIRSDNIQQLYIVLLINIVLFFIQFGF